ncbi:MAG: cytochrome b/b6 domain-containing protein [Steroidobacteraceae bacterium]
MSGNPQTPHGPEHAARAQGPDPSRLVWDLPVRLFHWLLVLAVLGSYITHRLGLSWFKYHLWCGYTVLVLVTARILWGVVGTRHARFAGFLRGPRTMWRYLTSWKKGTLHAVGHNPLGAWMVVLLLLLLLAQALTGLYANDQISNTGPLFGYVSGRTSDQLSSWHHWIFNILLGAIGLHVIAVLVYRLVRREDLITPMFSGRKRHIPITEEIKGSRTWLFALILLIVSLALALIIARAPEASLSIF